MRLILHVGHGKTGSSWLQSWLAINSHILASKFNVRYIIDSSDPSLKGYFSMGNSHVIEPYLYGKVLHSSDLIDGLDPQGSLLFSGEKLMKILPSCQYRLEEIASSLGTEQPELVLMLRNPFDHALSLYNQKVKSQGLRISFESYLPMYDLPNMVLSFLRKYPAAYAFHYDNYASKLYAPLLDILSLPDNYGWDLPPFEIVNRSLSSSELQLMRLLNGLLPVQSSRFIGDKLLSFRPNLAPEKTRFQFDNKLVREFNSRWSPVVDAINSFVPKESMLSLPTID